MVSSSDVQRLFLQAAISRGIMPFKLAQTLWAQCVEAVKAVDEHLNIPYSDSRAAWDEIVTKLNESLNNLDLEFRHLHDERDGREMYALVNTKGDGIAQMATGYSPVEIAYFKAIVEQIMLAPHESFCISSLGALREVNQLKSNMTKTQAEAVLGSFVARGWLRKSKRGQYSLSTRTLLELNHYLKTTYPDELLECTICMEMITCGVACYTTNCKTRMHYHCFNNYRRRNASCPACSKDWPSEANQPPLVPVGEAAAKDGQDDRRRVRRRNTQASDDEDTDGEAPSQSQSQSQNSRRKVPGQSQPRSQRPQRARKTRNQASMDIDEGDNDGYSPPKRSQAGNKRQANGRR